MPKLYNVDKSKSKGDAHHFECFWPFQERVSLNSGLNSVKMI